ncbi:coiled-coil domain-containing protein 66 isoform X2 [Archocentrus centrarchus]|uniref:coiled-coil domain-containing protein 66 isoform X2 n=1 Tax=Archocentrus centrarchus TaxID=63155 RepID=UPI0011EA087D|nr:coiled-coil domain-containing protein 66 isoform X2 [Archocentrus centrarchus]
MNLGDGLLFELENGKPKLILLSHGADKNPAKLSFRPRAASILSCRQTSCVADVHGEERLPRQLAGRHREARGKAGGAAASVTSGADGNGATLTTTKTRDHHKGGTTKAVAKAKSDRHKHSVTLGPPRAGEKTAQAGNTRTRGSGKLGFKDTAAGGDAGPKDSVVCLTSEQLQHILSTVQISSVQRPPEDRRTQGSDGNQTSSKSGCSENEGGGGGGDMKEKDRGGGGTDSVGSSQQKDSRFSGSLLSWLEERQSDSKAAVEAKKAQWKKELDEQVALKQQQRSAPGRLQAEEDTQSVLSVQSCVSHREQPPAIRSSLRLGEVTPMGEEVLSVQRREEQRRRWLEELDHQREEMTERRRREKLLQNQTEDHELWAAHFDSLQRRPPVRPAAPSAAQFSSSERGDWEPSSSLSLVWDATSSCGAESVAGASVETGRGYPTRTNFLRTMTSLLDPAQIEERERRRLKQLEQQRAIEAQVEERRRQREQEEAKIRREEEEEERRVVLEREMLQRQYEMDTLKEKERSADQAERLKKSSDDGRQQGALEPKGTSQAEGLEDVGTSVSSYRDTAVQTGDTSEASPDAAPCLLLRAQTPDASMQFQPPPHAAPPPSIRSRALRTGKENICLPAGGDPYEAFARTEKSRREKRRPEWNTQRPSRRFVPASERYPAALQRNRQESRLRRQAELLALQERTCLPRTDPPPPPQELRLCPNTTQTRTSPPRKVESSSRGHGDSTGFNNERGRSPPVPAVRHGAQSRHASSPPPLVSGFVPYIRTDEVFHLNPLEPVDSPPPVTHSGAPPQRPVSPPSHRDPLLHPELLRNTRAHRQQEILRGLAQLRQGLLLKQRELETDLNPFLKRHDNEHRMPSTSHRM